MLNNYQEEEEEEEEGLLLVHDGLCCLSLKLINTAIRNNSYLDENNFQTLPAGLFLTATSVRIL